MNNLIEKAIKTEIEKNVCPEHGEHPKVTFTTSGFEVSCCCKAFHQSISDKCEQAVGKAIHEHMMRMFRGEG